MTPAIRIDNLSKVYRIGKRSIGHYATLRESLSNAFSASVRGLGRLLTRRGDAGDGGGPANSIWALKDVCLEIEPGEVVGVIGGNGAGKSTLLKVLSRITEPTNGRVELRGRVGSLLEVGTGFHQELTGRDNIYLNGAILGLTRREIARRFDNIVAFSEVEQFLDTPVKRYSSGMYTRLAFAVAAHLDPEILIVDEVLAVGDLPFQRRCVQRMADLAESGRTVLVVSHNMDLIPRLCKRAVLMERGRVVAVGPAADVTAGYVTKQLHEAEGADLTRKNRMGNGKARFLSVRLVGPDGQPRLLHRCGEDLILRMEVESSEAIADVALAVMLESVQGARVVTGWTKEHNYHANLNCGRQTFECRFERVRFRPGHRAVVGLWMAAGPTTLDHVDHATVIEITDGKDTQNVSTNEMQGLVVVNYQWNRVGELSNGHAVCATSGFGNVDEQ
jgi:lipopolysaccharide transport system ATP-binding protein